MVVNKHGSFYLRSGWGTKIIQAVNADDMIFTPANEMQAVDNIGLGRVSADCSQIMETGSDRRDRICDRH